MNRFAALWLVSFWLPQSGGSFLVLPSVFLLKALDATRRVNQLLFAGEERMAIRADFDVNVFLGRTRRPGGAAGANDMTFDVFWMNSFFHFRFSFINLTFRSLLAVYDPMSLPAQKSATYGKAQKYPINSYRVKDDDN